MIRVNILILVLFSVELAVSLPEEDPTNTPIFVSREEWGARDPIAKVESMSNPVSHVIIHHSFIPPPCETPQRCVDTVREIQRMHMDESLWFDIGYSFLAGGDGRAYVGRGWDKVGSHAPGYNKKSIGICLIGDWRYYVPPAKQLEVVHNLIAYGVENGMIAKDYTLLGHRQTRYTICPGQTLYDEITTWPHYSPCPQPVDPSQQNITLVCPDMTL